MKEQLNQLAVMAIVLSFLIAGCSSGAAPVPPTQPPPTQALPAQGKDPESVLKAITEALNGKDADGATALLAEDVTQTLVPAPSGTGIYQGKDAMRALQTSRRGQSHPQTHELPDERRQGDVRGNVQRRFDQADGV